MSMDRDIQFLYEMGSLRFIPRQWTRFLNTDFANLTEHHFRVLWLSLVISQHEGVKDHEKIMKMALVHDIAESRTGDVDYLSRQYVERNEELGIKDMLGGTILEDDFMKAWQEYEERQSLEAKIVKDADNLEVDFELREQSVGGSPLAKEWKRQRNHVRDILFTETAKKIFDEVQQSNPHDWHTKGRNRINAGDWQK